MYREVELSREGTAPFMPSRSTILRADFPIMAPLLSRLLQVCTKDTIWQPLHYPCRFLTEGLTPAYCQGDASPRMRWLLPLIPLPEPGRHEEYRRYPQVHKGLGDVLPGRRQAASREGVHGRPRHYAHDGEEHVGTQSDSLPGRCGRRSLKRGGRGRRRWRWRPLFWSGYSLRLCRYRPCVRVR